jgi:hypothetical protein
MADKNITYIKGREKQEVSIETVCNEMAQLLQIDNLSFLIGAGCSSNIVDVNETGIPGMVAIYRRFFEAFPDFEIAGQKVSGRFDGNLEKLLEIMGAIQIANDISVIDDQIDKKIKCVRNFLRKQIVDGLNGNEVKDIYKDFYTKITQRSRKSPISIFTTNYDLFSEMALDELGFPYNNGFSGTYKRKFSPASYNYMYVENMNLNRDVWERISSFFNLVKLHGSVSWIRKDDQVWEQDYESVSDDDTVMIFPTPLKDRATLMTPYSDLFRTMENRLMQKNSTLVVMGYSFGDDHINRVILNGLAVPTFRLVVFGNSANIDKLTEMGDTRITVINSDDKIHYFNNIVEKVLPSVHPDVEEEMQFQPVNQLIDSFKSEASE